ncbi:sensor histidine kinase [Pedobacter cryoconitis]|uniref:sensor histidine kinase n=1 Tax=Pedobacter cryoconitis TaxID=188932 RepID=UPI001B86803F|nr:histidine kinase [Pedobacter cryoconitis]
MRAVTDLTKHEVFWSGSIILHLIGISFTISLCYFYDFLWRRQLDNSTFPERDQSITKEYLQILLQLSGINILLLMGQYVGIFHMGSGWIDYMLINLCFIPFLMIYYTLIRNEKVSRNYKDKILMLEKLKADKSESELKFLKSQYHPHFLFNALNTIYFQIDENNVEAKRSIETLSDLLRYQLYDIEKEVTFEQEINYLRAYIAFQKIRMSRRLCLNAYFDPQLKEQKIHPLLFQPIIENAFKYVGGEYKIKIELKLDDKKIRLYVENTISPMWQKEKCDKPGIGLDNLLKRLDLLYPGKYNFYTEQISSLFFVRLIINTD